MDPFKGLKRELAVITAVCLVVLLVVFGLRLSTEPAIAILALVGFGGALWLIWRTRRVTERLRHAPPAEEKHDGR